MGHPLTLPTTPQPSASHLHRDHLGSVRAITDNAGARPKSPKSPATVYKPYGERTPTINLTVAPEDREDKGWTLERFDPETGLQYLNARYYDPELGLFLQPTRREFFQVLELC